MDKNDIQQGMGETYFYACHKCKQANLSRDEVFGIDLTANKYLCLKCWRKEGENKK